MNMYLRGIGGEDSPLTVGYPLIADTGERFDMVMTNPNFGKESSITVFGGDDNGKADKEAIIYETGFLGNYMQQTTQFLEHV
jgi:type I restriction enzyme M protein